MKRVRKSQQDNAKNPSLIVPILGIIMLLCLFISIPVTIYLETKTTTYRDLPDQKIENVKRVLMHTPKEYSFLIQNPGSKELILETHYIRDVYNRGSGESGILRQGKVKLLSDVLKNQNMWALIKKVEQITTIPNSSWKQEYYLEIHMHSENNMDGGSWQRSCGKGCTEKGQTNVIE